MGRARRRRPGPFLWLLGALLLLVLGGGLFWLTGPGSPADLVERTRIRKALLEHRANPAALRPLVREIVKVELARAHFDTALVAVAAAGRPDSLVDRWELLLTPTQSPRLALEAVERGVRRLGNAVSSREETRDAHRLVARMAFGLTLDVALRTRTRARGVPRLALVVEQFGHHQTLASQQILDMGQGFSVAILPYTTAARDLAVRCRDAGLEVLVHLPMEGNNYPRFDPGPGAILVDQDGNEIRRRVAAAFDQLDVARGALPFLGEMAIDDRDVMTAVMAAVAEKGGYFVDTPPSGYSMIRPAAAAAGVAVVRAGKHADDDKASVEWITANLVQLAEDAVRSGSAVVRLRPYPNTVAALRNLLPQWQSAGIELVPLSELAAVPQ